MLLLHKNIYMDRKIDKKKVIIKKYIMPAIVVVIVVFFATKVLISNNEARLNIDQSKISIETVQHNYFQDYIAVIGTVEPIQTIYLDAIEGGRVDEILIEEGNTVKKGDVIIKLSNNHLLLEISNIEAQVARAVNDLKTTRINHKNLLISAKIELLNLHYSLLEFERKYKSNELLYNQNHITNEEFQLSKEDYDFALQRMKLLKEKYNQDSILMKTRIQSSEEQIERMQNNLTYVRKRLEALDIKAPIEGKLAILYPEIGQVINYGTRIGSINVLDSYKIRVEVDEHYIARINKGLMGEFDFAGGTHKLKIKKIYPEVQNRRFALDMVFLSEIPEQIRIGQTARIKIELGESKMAILIPRGGFYQSTGGQYIYLLNNSEDFAIKKDIRIGRQNTGYYEVLEGLKAGDKVIVSSYDNFGDADKLILKN